MRNKIAMLIAVGFAVCLYPNLGEAQQYRTRMGQKSGQHQKFQAKRQFGKKRDMMQMLELLTGDLSLSKKQKAELKDLSYEFKKARIDHQADIKKADLELRYLKRDETASKESVMSAIDRVAQSKAEMQKLKYLHRQDIRSVFTEKQLKELKELKKKRRLKKRELRHEAGNQFRMKRRYPTGGQTGI